MCARSLIVSAGCNGDRKLVATTSWSGRHSVGRAFGTAQACREGFADVREPINSALVIDWPSLAQAALQLPTVGVRFTVYTLAQAN